MPGARGRGLQQGAAEHPFDLAARQAPGAQQHRRVETTDNGGFDPDRDRAAVDDQVDQPREVALHMGGGGRGDVAR